MKIRRLDIWLILILVSGFSRFVVAQSKAPMDLERSTFLGRADARLEMKSIVFAFKVQNEQELARLLQEQQDPRSPRYHQWLTPEEFGRRFGVPEETYQRAVRWLEANGFSVTRQLPNQLRIYFDGTAESAERAFHVAIGLYQLEDKTYYSNDLPPQLPTEFVPQGLGVFELDNFPKEMPLFRDPLRGLAMAPADMHIAHNLLPLFASSINGAGQNIAIVARSDFNVSDVQLFRSNFGLPPNDPQKVFAENQGNRGGGEETEVLLDTEWSGAMAPNATIQVVISTSVSFSLDYTINSLPTAHIISISFGLGESVVSDGLLNFRNSMFAQAASEGQTVFVSSGDEGAQQSIGSSTKSAGQDINYLCASPYVVCVGGSELNPLFDANGNATGYGGEVAWHESGGGKSRLFDKPSYQTGPGVPSDSKRDVPDVAAMASPSLEGAFLYRGGTLRCCFGGTSLSAPVWAGFFALVNQAASPGGTGWANPRLYEMARNQFRSGGPAVFNDIITGDNSTSTVTGFTAGVGYDQVTGWGSFNGDLFVRNFAISDHVNLTVPGSGAISTTTNGANTIVRAGYAIVNVSSGDVPFGTAVFSVANGAGVVTSEAGVPASPPTTHGLVFIDYRTGVGAKSGGLAAGTLSVNTGLAVVNRGTGPASVQFILRNAAATMIVAQGTGIIPLNAHRAKFITELNQIVPDFNLPGNFPTTLQFGSLEILSDQPLSILGLRLTTNQRGETLLTSTPVADLTQPQSNSTALLSHFADGNGNQTAAILLNTSATVETGKVRFFNNNGDSQTVKPVGGELDHSFNYNIPAGGLFRLLTDGSPSVAVTGSIQIVPDAGTSTPVAAAVFSLSQGGILNTESGVPAATLTTHARVYIDLSGGHNTGLAMAAPSTGAVNATLTAYQTNGTTPQGSPGNVTLNPNGHDAKFADQFISGLPSGFTGVLDISSPTPFAAVTLRSLTNSRGEFLITTFPIADVNRAAPSPIIFPQIADSGGFKTQFIFLVPSLGGSASALTLNYLGDDGSPIALATSGK